MQKELEDILKFYDLIYLQYSTAFSIYQFILYLSSSASRISITVAFFVDWKTLAKCIFHDSHLIMSHIALVYLVVFRDLGQIYLTYRFSIVYRVSN